MRLLGTIVGVLLCLTAAPASSEVFGNKKSGVKGRYLEVEAGVNLRDYRDAIIILEPADIVSDKDKPVDTEAVRTTSDQLLREKLQAVGSIRDIVADVPMEIAEGTPLIKLRNQTHPSARIAGYACLCRRRGGKVKTTHRNGAS